MQKSRKLIALICSLAMVFTLFANFSVISASADDSAAFSLVYDADSSTATEKVIKVYYSGLPEGFTSFEVDVKTPANTVSGTAKAEITGLIVDSNFIKDDEVFVFTGMAADKVKSDDGLLGTITLTLSEELTEDFSADIDTEYSFLAVGTDVSPAPATTVVIPAPEVEATPIPTAEPIAEGTVGIELVYDAENSTETEKVIRVYYRGLDEGFTSFEVDVKTPENTVSGTAKAEITGLIVDSNFIKEDNVFVFTGMAADKVKSDDGLLGTITLTLSEDLGGEFKADIDTEYSFLAVGTDVSPAPATYAVIAPVAADEPTPTPTAPAETPTPTPTAATETEAPTATPVAADARPTKVPVATDAPAEPTDVPTETEEPKATSIPTAEPIAEGTVGIELVYDAENSTETDKVIKVYYRGLDEGFTSFEVDVKTPENTVSGKAEAAITGLIVDSNFIKEDNVFVFTGMAADKVKSDDGLLGTITLTLSEDLTEEFKADIDTEYSFLAVGTSVSPAPDTYVVIAPVAADEPTPTPTAPAEDPTPTPTAEPTEAPVLGSVDLDALVDPDLAKDAEDADKVPYVTYTVTDENGNPAEYGTDYVVKDADGNIVDKDTFENDIWGYGDTPVSEAIKKYTIVAYNSVKVSAKLQVEGEDKALDSGEKEIKKADGPTPTPTARPADPNGVVFDQWSAKTIAPTKTSTKQSTATFTGIPADAKNIKISFSTEDTTLVTLSSGSTTTLNKSDGTKTAKAIVKVTAKKNKKDSTTVTATLSYTLDGTTYYVDSTDLTVNTKTSSSSGSSSSSGGTSGGNVIATGTTSNTGLWGGDGQVHDVNFIDLNQAPWAEDAIRFLAEKGIVNGRSATEFEPNGYITRAEFAKLVVTVFGINAQEGIEAQSFPDVQAGTWYNPYVITAAHYGIVTGYPDGLFRPDALVSRQEMALMMYRACRTFNIALPQYNAAIAFEDGVADWAAEAVTALQVAGVVNGTSATTFGPTDASTRAQAAQMIYNLYQIVD